MWIEILSKYFEENVEIRKDQPLGFLVIEPKHLKFKYETSKKKKKKKFKPKDYVINIKDYDINNIATDRINQIIPLPKILKGAIEDVYQTPFRLLGNFGERQFNKIKRKISRSNTFY